MPAVSRIAPRARHNRHGNDIAPATVTLVHRFFLAEADGRYLRVGDRARDDAVIDVARLIIGKRIVNSDAAVLAPIWPPTPLPITSPPVKMFGTFVRRYSLTRT
jgi:hypothetical protein